MNHLKKLVAIIICITVLSTMCLLGSAVTVSASGTGAGLAEWAMNAYYSGWAYVYGGSTPGAVDCSGLIYSYAGGERTGDAQLYAASESGYVSNGIPRVHGLGLYHPGHVGVYVGNGMSVDARGDDYGVCYSSVDYMGWTNWFKLSNVSYPTTGWVEFNGDYFYYENGQYIVNTSRDIDGETYYFGSDGVSNTVPSDMSGTASDSSSNNSSNNNTSSGSSSNESTAPKYETIQLGSEGESVTNLQERLQELGYYKGEITGYFDEETEKAYILFQTTAGVTVDGISGNSDQELLYSDDAPYAPEEPAQDEEATKRNNDVQTKLKELNYYWGDCDGILGEMSIEAIKSFQYINGLTATGEIDDETYKAIMSEDAQPNPNYVEETTLEPVTTYTFNAYALNQSGIMGPSDATLNATTQSFILPNEKANANSQVANTVAAETNKLAKNAVSGIEAESFTKVAPVNSKVNVFGFAIVFVLGVFSLISIYLLISAKKERARKAARATMRQERRMAKTDSEARYWW